MTTTWSNGPVTLYTGHVLEALRALPAESVQCVVTSPPYWGLRSYSVEPVVWDAGPGCEHEWGEQVYQRRTNDGGQERKETTNAGAIGREAPVHHAFCLRCGAWRGSLGLEPTPQFYVRHLVAVFREVRRVLRSDGVCFLNLGDSYAGSGVHAEHHSNPGLSKAGQREGFRPGAGRANGLVDSRAQRNRDGIGGIPGLKPKDLVGIPWRVALALQEDGWWLRSDIIWAKPNPMPESVTDRPTRSHEYIFLLTKSERYFWGQEAVREEATGRTQHDLTGQGYSAPGQTAQNGNRGKAYGSGNKQRRLGAGGIDDHLGSSVPWQDNGSGRNLRSVWTIATQPYSGAHFATFPEALVERCVLAGTSERGCCPECGAPWEQLRESTGHVNQREPAHAPKSAPTKVDSTGWAPTTRAAAEWRPACVHADLAPVPCTVLDPLSGAGTVALVAQKLGRRAIGVDLSPQYTALAVKRLEEVPLPMGGG